MLTDAISIQVAISIWASAALLLLSSLSKRGKGTIKALIEQSSLHERALNVLSTPKRRFEAWSYLFFGPRLIQSGYDKVPHVAASDHHRRIANHEIRPTASLLRFLLLTIVTSSFPRRNISTRSTTLQTRCYHFKQHPNKYSSLL